MKMLCIIGKSTLLVTEENISLEVCETFERKNIFVELVKEFEQPNTSVRKKPCFY
jgi:hypothetical protein